jgi:drug/metabolite transporter (DMT)-like permease
MKRGIGWIGFKGKKDKKFYRNLILWIVGFILINIYIVPNTVALKYLAPHLVSSMAGWGIIVMIFFSYLILKEKLYRSDYFYTILIVVSIIFLHLFEYQESEVKVNISVLIAVAFFPLSLLLPALLRFVSKRIKKILFAVLSGISAGLIIVMMKVLVTFLGFDVPSYLASPYFYLYLFFSIAAFITLQVAYKLGQMMTVGPIQYSAVIIYPALCSFLVFGKHINLMQIVAIAAIIYGVVAILRKH